MRIAIKILLLIILSSSWVYSKQYHAQFEHANDLYSAGDYDSALTLYNKILEDGLDSKELYFNLGNSYFKKGQVANAILNYERARKLAPDDEDIAFNLELVNLKVVDKIEPLPEFLLTTIWKHIIQWNNSTEWTIYSLLFLWSTFILGVTFLLVRNVKVKRVSFFWSLLFLIAAGFAIYFGYIQNENEHSGRYAILSDQSAYIKSAPDASSTDLFVLHEGVKFRVIDEVGEWGKIKLADGKQGWIEMDAFEKI